MHMRAAERICKPMRIVLVLLAVCTGPVRAQSSALPSSSPTGTQDAISNSTANAQGQTSASHLAVLWNGVSLQVDATNVSLSSVLHEISVKTKLRITGSAPDERIFGTYGPGPMNLVLPALLDGLPINMLLTERTGGAPGDLSLTGRSGVPTPASVPTQQALDQSSAPPQTSTGNGRPTGGFGSPQRSGQTGNQGSGPIAGPTLGDKGISGSDNGISGPNNGVSGADNGIGVAPSGTDVNATGTASPNGVRTPQEIFEQLQKLRQQQGQPQ